MYYFTLIKPTMGGT